MEPAKTELPESQPNTCSCIPRCQRCIWESYVDAQESWQDLYRKQEKPVDNK